MINIFKNNLKIKIISIFFAFFMWVYVMAEADPILIRDFNDIPITITNLEQLKDNGMTIDHNTRLRSNVILRARRSLLKDITRDVIKVYGTIKNPQLGENKIDLRIELPNNIEYTIIPDKLTVIVEENVVLRKEIEVQTKGTPKEGVKVSDINLNPKSTWIEGPKSIVSKVDKLICKLNLENKEHSFNVRAEIIPIDQQGNTVEGVYLRDRYTYVNLNVLNSKRVPIKVDMNDISDKGYKLLSYNLDNKMVTIYGNKRDLDNIDAIYTEKVDISNLKESTKKFVNLIIPENIDTTIKSVGIDFKVSKIISKEFYIPKSRINFNNNIQNLDISKNNLPDEIRVKVVYLEEFDSKLKEEDIQIFVNMQEVDPEHLKYELKYYIPYPVEYVDIMPKFVEIYR
ncbi:CdaR family protein [Alkalithermobacter paradoxus]|uniref:YbbR-like protein n=1 Tax=Alkalithermobacter paradoxus TaxID=29349 RepID=A0A1V4I3W6_9FIRM|nr:YbbR-like protein [[Clostridium] thermoalcaliphilum]